LVTVITSTASCRPWLKGSRAHAGALSEGKGLVVVFETADGGGQHGGSQYAATEREQGRGRKPKRQSATRHPVIPVLRGGRGRSKFLKEICLLQSMKCGVSVSYKRWFPQTNCHI
jgi:hypothetical protein